MGENGSLTFHDAIEVLKDLAAEHFRTTGRHMDGVVVIGGTALAARGVRDRSDDIDFYAPDIDDGTIERTVARHITRFGPRFKIDATPSNTIWGAIALLDINNAPEVTTVTAGGRPLRIQALTVETMYLVKSAANRPKDRADVRALAGKTTYEALLARARQVFPWYSDRTAFPEHAERLARQMARDFKVPLSQVTSDFNLSAGAQQRIADIRSASEVQFWNALKALMREKPELLTFNIQNPRITNFDARRAGAPDEVLDLIKAHPQQFFDLASNILREKNPARHLEQMKAIRNQRGGMGE